MSFFEGNPLLYFSRKNSSGSHTPTLPTKVCVFDISEINNLDNSQIDEMLKGGTQIHFTCSSYDVENPLQGFQIGTALLKVIRCAPLTIDTISLKGIDLSLVHPNLLIEFASTINESVKYIDLTNTNLSKFKDIYDVINFLSCFHQELHGLSLRDNGLSQFSAQDLVDILCVIPHISELDLGANLLGEFKLKDQLKMLEKMPRHLKILNLGFNGLDINCNQEDFNTLIRHMPILEKLDISCNGLNNLYDSQDKEEELTQLLKRKGFKHVKLEENHLTMQDCKMDDECNSDKNSSPYKA